MRKQIFTIVGATILFGGSMLSGRPAKAQAPASCARAGDDPREMEAMTREVSEEASGQIRDARAARCGLVQAEAGADAD